MAVRSLLGRAAALAAVPVLGLLGACGGDDGGDRGAFCTQLEDNLEAVVRPTIGDGDGADAYVALLRDLGERAPLAIEEDWDALVLQHETANAVLPGDEESEQRAVAAAYAAERSAIAVQTWVQTNCGFDLGPVVTVGDVPPPTTTIPAPTTAAPTTTVAASTTLSTTTTTTSP